MLCEVFVLSNVRHRTVCDITVGLREDEHRDEQGGLQLGVLELGTERWRCLYLVALQQRT